MDIRAISDIVYANIDDRERMEKMNALYYEIADFVKDHDMQAYKKFYEEAEAIVYDLNEEQAQQVVRYMKPYGEHWSQEAIKNFVTDKGEGAMAREYYMVMNMVYNDYNRTASMYGHDDAEFYYNLAYDFIHDLDAPARKVDKYFMDLL